MTNSHTVQETKGQKKSWQICNWKQQLLLSINPWSWIQPRLPKEHLGKMIKFCLRKRQQKCAPFTGCYGYYTALILRTNLSQLSYIKKEGKENTVCGYSSSDNDWSMEYTMNKTPGRAGTDGWPGFTISKPMKLNVLKRKARSSLFLEK